MDVLTKSDLVDIAEYEKQRIDFRSQVMEAKRHRRIPVGDLVTLVFENRETVRFQIQEMMRAERIVEDDRIQEELDTYNQLIPGRNELSATLFVEVPDQSQIREVLDKFIGIDKGETTFVVIGKDRVAGEFEGGHSSEERISAVHYVRFPLTDDQARRFAAGEGYAAVVIDHPNYHAETELTDSVRNSLAKDLQ